MAWQHISSEVTVKGLMQWMGLMICCEMMAKMMQNVRSVCVEDEGTDCEDGDGDTVW
jgi:hypothetical protein